MTVTEIMISAAKRVAAESPPLDGWHTGVGANPEKYVLQYVRDAGGWPERAEVVRLGKWRRIVVVPESWLRRLAEITGRPWSAANRGGVCRRLVDPAADR